MPDPLRLRDLDEELSIFKEAWLHDEPGIGIREWLSFASKYPLCRKGRCQILAHAVREG